MVDGSYSAVIPLSAGQNSIEVVETDAADAITHRLIAPIYTPDTATSSAQPIPGGQVTTGALLLLNASQQLLVAEVSTSASIMAQFNNRLTAIITGRAITASVARDFYANMAISASTGLSPTLSAIPSQVAAVVINTTTAAAAATPSAVLDNARSIVQAYAAAHGMQPGAVLYVIQFPENSAGQPDAYVIFAATGATA
ncbi:MAG: hypothetical protein EXR67_04555 [Dehalococcoidia bacterium]|nr:hypothetical protein [Dehalococcoidia bacterium]